MENLKIFSGDMESPLVKSICSHLKIGMGDIYTHVFPSNEHYVQFQENIRGCDVFLFRSNKLSTNDSLMQLLVMTDAARRASAGRISIVCPLFFYQRQERKDKPRVPISAKLVMDLFEAAGANRILTMDLHAPQIAGFTNLPLDQLYFRPVLIDALGSNHIDVVVAPDMGAVKRTEEYARKMRLDIAFLTKKRIDDNTVQVGHFVGDVNDKNVLIVDDMTESVGTLIEAARVCKENGAKKVVCAVSHLCLSEVGKINLRLAQEKLVIDYFYASNSTDNAASKSKYHQIVDVSALFSKAISSIHNNESISTIFD